MSRSKDLVSALIGYKPIDHREEISLSRVRDLLTRGDNVFSRGNDLHHITGSAIIVSHAGLLLHYHKTIRKWLQPGGHIEEGESPYTAAMREAFEETGLSVKGDPKIFHLDVHETPSGHVHYDIRFLVKTTDVYPNPPNGESQNVAWFSRSTFAKLNEPGLNGAIKKLIAWQL